MDRSSDDFFPCSGVPKDQDWDVGGSNQLDPFHDRFQAGLGTDNHLTERFGVLVGCEGVVGSDRVGMRWRGRWS